MARLQRSTAVAAIAAAILSHPALAQAVSEDASAGKAATEKARDKDAAEDGTIVVTASKTGAQSLQQVPLAIQAFSGEELKERNINTIGDLVSSVPGAQEGFRQSNGSRFYNLRGNVTQNGDSPIGYYLDETPFIVTNFGIAPPVRFIDIERKSDAEAAGLIRQMEIDIAVDLMGYTGESRAEILAFRPAPIQVNYLGFPGTMAADHIDYIIADRVVIDDGVKEVVADPESENVWVTFDARKTHAPAIHDAILKSGYKPAPFAD